MSAASLIEQIRLRGVALSVSGDSLRCLAPPGRLSPELLAALTENKPEIIALLRSAKPLGASESVVRNELGRPACAGCRHVSAFGNCGEPVDSGISIRFEIVRHPNHGEACPAYEVATNADQTVLLNRLQRLAGVFYDEADVRHLRSAILNQDDLLGVEFLLTDAEEAVRRMREPSAPK